MGSPLVEHRESALAQRHLVGQTDEWTTVAIIPPWGPNSLQRLWAALNDKRIESNTHLEEESGHVLLRVHAADVQQAQEIAERVGWQDGANGL